MFAYRCILVFKENSAIVFVGVGGEGVEDSAAEVMAGHCGCRYGRMLTARMNGTLAFT